MVRGGVTLSIGVLALAALSPAFAPDRAPPPDGRPAAAAAPAPETPPARRSPDFRVAEIAADARGQFAVEALVDGAPVHMLIDTGANVVAVSTATAARLGLTFSALPKWTIRTANGVSLASPVTLDSVSFGGLYMRDVERSSLRRRRGT